MAIFSEEERLGLSLKCFVRLNDDKFMPLLKIEWVRALPR